MNDGTRNGRRGLTAMLLPAVALLVLLMIGWVGCAPVQVGENEIGLRKPSVFNMTEAAAPVMIQAEAGDSKLLPRAYHDAPPMIPHSIVDMKVNPGTNDCMDCHEEGDQDTPGIPPSHRIKARMVTQPLAQASGPQLTRFDGFYRVENVAGNRFDCMLCHAPQVQSTAQLEDNTFQPEALPGTEKDVLDQLNAKGTY